MTVYPREQWGVFQKEATLQPHRCRYWLNPKKDNEDEFKLQVNKVCVLYQLAQELLARNIHLVSTIEIT